MFRYLYKSLFASLILASVAPVISASGQTPLTVSADPKALSAAHHRLDSGDAKLQPALDALLHEADRALKAKPSSVMDKPKAGPSGDKHDYVSYAPYFWPNPATADGLPYIRKDGHRNREMISQGDAPRLEKMQGTVHTLALAYYFTGKGEYADHAAQLLRVWFIDPSTRMNPNFKGAQAVLGVNGGRGTGLIEFAGMPGLVDSIILLKSSSSWSSQDQATMNDWLTTYQKWLATDPEAEAERKAANNHGSWFAAEEISLLLYLGKTAEATAICDKFKSRIDTQIRLDGSMPLELSRADGFSYSLFNLNAIMQVASMASRLNVDLWHYQSPAGGSIPKALDYLVPYADPTKKWPHNQLAPIKPEVFIPVLIRAKSVFGPDPYGKQLALLLKEAVESDRMNLFVEGEKAK